MAKKDVPKREDQGRASIPYVGRQSGRSSSRWFGGADSGLHPQGNGASAGDGRTTDSSLKSGLIKLIFRRSDGSRTE